MFRHLPARHRRDEHYRDGTIRGTMTQDPEYRRLVRLAGSYNSKARRYGVKGTISADELWAVEALIDHCVYCGITLEWGRGTFDHVNALDRGGPNTMANIERCCTTCQRTKFTKTVTELTKYTELVVTCEVCGKQFQPRWAEYQRGMARTCSRSCSAKKRWQV